MKEDRFWQSIFNEFENKNYLLREPAHIFLQMVCINSHFYYSSSLKYPNWKGFRGITVFIISAVFLTEANHRIEILIYVHVIYNYHVIRSMQLAKTDILIINCRDAMTAIYKYYNTIYKRVID